MIISIVHSNSHITERITNILDYHLHHPYTISNTLILADLYFTDTLEDIPRIRNINKKAFIVIVTNHPLGPDTVIYQPFYYIFEDSLEKDIPEEIQEELKKLMDLEDNKIKVNADFILMAFQIIGGIAQRLENSYWEYKKNKYKIK